MDTTSHTTTHDTHAEPRQTLLPIIGAAIFAALWGGYALFFFAGYLTR